MQLQNRRPDFSTRTDHWTLYIGSRNQHCSAKLYVFLLHTYSRRVSEETLPQVRRRCGACKDCEISRVFMKPCVALASCVSSLGPILSDQEWGPTEQRTQTEEEARRRTFEVHGSVVITMVMERGSRSILRAPCSLSMVRPCLFVAGSSLSFYVSPLHLLSFSPRYCFFCRLRYHWILVGAAWCFGQYRACLLRALLSKPACLSVTVRLRGFPAHQTLVCREFRGFFRAKLSSNPCAKRGRGFLRAELSSNPCAKRGRRIPSS